MLKAVGIGGAVGLAGCMSGDGDGDGSGDGLGDTLVGPDGEQVSLKFMYRTGTDTGETTAQFIGSELEQIGFNIEYDAAPFDNLIGEYMSTGPEGGETAGFNAGDRDEFWSPQDWDLMWGVGFNTYPMTPASTATFFTDERNTGAADINFYGYRPSDGRDMQETFQEITVETDEDERRARFAELFGYISEEQPFGMISFGEDIHAFQSNVENVEPGFAIGYQSQRWAFSDGGGNAGNAFIFGDSSDASTLNFLRISDTSSSARVLLTMDGAYTINNDLEVEPRWVESIEANDDFTRYDFTFRDNLRWSDPYGQMTADDWVYFIENVRQGEDNWAGDTNRGQWFVGEEPIQAEAVDDLTLRLTLPETDPDFPRKPVMWATFCMPRDLVEPYVEAQDGEGLNEDEEVTTLSYAGNLGPYTYDTWERDSRFTATRNDDYYLREVEGYADTPNFDERTYQVFDEESTRLSAMESGEITHTELPPERASSFEEMDNVQIELAETPYISVLSYNQRANGWEPFREKEVRQAFAYAVDKQTITDDILRGYAVPAHTYQPQFSDWYDDSEVMETGVGDSHDYARAKELLNDALDDYEYV
ncbi:ABC transporter substrate-binding protein [Haloferacaceae archaeon DSL9]